MKLFSHMLNAVAAAILVVAPVAAEAGTRAGDSGAVYDVSDPGLGREDKGESLKSGVALLLLLLGSGAAAALVFWSGDDGQSPGF